MSNIIDLWAKRARDIIAKHEPVLPMNDIATRLRPSVRLKTQRCAGAESRSERLASAGYQIFLVRWTGLVGPEARGRTSSRVAATA